MNEEDERLKAQERRNRQMASGGVTMPADLVAVTQQAPVATARTTASIGNGGPTRQNRNLSPNNRRQMARVSRSGSPGAPRTSATSAAERNRQRMAEEERLKAQARQGRVTSATTRMSADLAPGGAPGGAATRGQPGPQRYSPQRQQAPAPVRRGAPNQPAVSNPNKTTDQRMREEEELKAAGRRSRLSPIRTNQMPQDLRMEAGHGAPAPVGGNFPSNKRTVVASQQAVKDQERQARDLVHGTVPAPRKLSPNTRGTCLAQPVSLPSDLQDNVCNAPSEEFRVSTTIQSTTIASHQDVKNQERQARDLVAGSFTPSNNTRNSRLVVAANRPPSDVVTNGPAFEPLTSSTSSGTTNDPAKNREREAREMVRVVAAPAPHGQNGAPGGKQQEKQARDMVSVLTAPPAHQRATAENRAPGGKQQEKQARDMVSVLTAPPPHQRATTTPTARQAEPAAPTYRRAVSDEVHASNRIAEEERIKQRARQGRVTALSASIVSQHEPAAPDLVAVTMEPVATVSMGSTTTAASATSSSSRTSRRTQDTDARAKERARRGRVSSAAGAESVDSTASPEATETMSNVYNMVKSGKSKGDQNMADVMETMAATAGPAVVEEEAPPMIIPVGAVSVFTNGVVVQQQRGELTNQPAAPPTDDSQRHRDGGDGPLVDKDEEDVEKPMDQTVATDAEQTLSAYTPGGDSGTVVTDLQKIDENKDDEVPWYKSSEFRLCFVCVLIAAIAGAVAGIVLSGGDGGDGGPAPPPTVPPETDSPTLSPTPRPLDEFRVQTARAEIVDGGVTSAAVLDDPSTPQHQAYLWLIQEDEFAWGIFGEGSLLPRYVLATFYYSLGGKSWLSHDGWLDSFVTHCDWEFVDCIENTPIVGRIFTAGRPGGTGNFEGSNNMEGSLPSEIVQFSSMAQLRLQGNRITDISALGQGMPVLAVLDVGGSPITDFSALLAMPVLETFSIRSSGVGGTIPSEFYTLSNMLSFDIGDNSFTGTLSTELGSFPVLRDAFLSDNNLEGNIGTIFESIQDRSTLRSFVADYNSLTGSLPTIIGDFAPTMTQMTVLSCQLHGTLPTELGLLTKLENLGLTNNANIDGTLPSEIGNMESLRELLLAGTFLEGPIPSEYGNLQNLKTLELTLTFVDGTTDENLCAIPDLVIESSFDLECTCPICI